MIKAVWSIIRNKEVRELLIEIIKSLADWKITKVEKEKIFKEALDVLKQYILNKKKILGE